MIDDREIAKAAEIAVTLFRANDWRWGKDKKPVTEADLALAIRRLSRETNRVRSGRLAFEPIFEDMDDSNRQTGVRVMVEIGEIPFLEEEDD